MKLKACPGGKGGWCGGRGKAKIDIFKFFFWLSELPGQGYHCFFGPLNLYH